MNDMNSDYSDSFLKYNHVDLILGEILFQISNSYNIGRICIESNADHWIMPHEAMSIISQRIHELTANICHDAQFLMSSFVG